MPLHVDLLQIAVAVLVDKSRLRDDDDARGPQPPRQLRRADAAMLDAMAVIVKAQSAAGHVRRPLQGQPQQSLDGLRRGGESAFLDGVERDLVAGGVRGPGPFEKLRRFGKRATGPSR